MRRPRRRLTLAFAGVALLALAGTGVHATLAAFSGTTSNPGNSFSAAASFGYASDFRMASGTYTGNAVDGRAIAAGFQPDLVIVKSTGTAIGVARTSTMTGDNAKPLDGATALTSNFIQSLTATGYTVGNDSRVNATGTTYYWTAFRAGTGTMRVGSYTGNNTAQSITGVGFRPEFVAVLGDVAEQAVQRYSGMSRTFRFDADTGITTGITSLDIGGFSLGSDDRVNDGGGSVYHYVAFNDRPGMIEVDSYTGDGSDNRNITGLGLDPGVTMIRTGDTASAERGYHLPAALTGGTSLPFDDSSAATNRIQSLIADGFQVGNDDSVNRSGRPYHHLSARNTAGGCSTLSSQTLAATADSWTDEASPTTNNGTSTVLRVRPNSGSRRRSFLQFNLPAVPAGCSVTAATLRIRNRTPVAGRTLQAFRNDVAWTEANVRWNNQPATTGAAATATTPGSASFMTWDVTTQVQAMSSGSNFGFQVRDANEGSGTAEQQFDSREATGTANDPQLIVEIG